MDSQGKRGVGKRGRKRKAAISGFSFLSTFLFFSLFPSGKIGVLPPSLPCGLTALWGRGGKCGPVLTFLRRWLGIRAVPTTYVVPTQAESFLWPFASTLLGKPRVARN